ncbi:zinc-binding dehydrogenase [Shinella sp.]|uniref:zinc-binding dehydrogenase n=1 Tax=Shinella sp. TaxID=1870904 RepID=UPI0040372682
MPMEIIIPARQTFQLQAYEDQPLQRGEIRGRTLCTLISQGTEIGWANGDTFPIRPGYAAVFEVEEIGEDVTDVKRGERRFAMGYHRSSQTHAAENTLPLPGGMAPETAVIARLMGVSMTTLMTTKARPGDRVVISGAGPVGFLAAHLFRIGGYRVTVVDPDALRRDQLAQSGITDTRAAMPLDDPDLQGKVALVVDCSGHEGAVLDGCRIVRRMGEVVLVGVPWRKYTDLTAHDVLNAVFFNHVTLRSGWEWELPMHGRSFLWEELLEGYNNAPHSIFSGFARAIEWLAEDRIPLDGLLHRATPENPTKLYADVMARQIAEPFIVVDWSRLSNTTGN